MDTDFPIFKGAAVQGGKPFFIFEIKITKIECRVSNSGEYVEGNPDNIYENTYHVTYALHDEPQIADTGHYWEIIELQKVGEVKLLI